MLFLALAALVAAFSFAVPSSVQAQEEDRPRIGLLNRLFGRPAYRIEEPPAEVGRPRAVRPQRSERPQRAERKKRPHVQREGDEPPQVAVVTKRPDAHVILVVGDFLGSGLAEGLTTAFIEDPNVRVVDRTSGSSGFVREDFHNWPEKVDELITAERPAAVVVMIGANDRQQMLVDGVRETVRSENWNAEYAERAGELAKAIAARKVPFLWVGMPPFKSSKTMLDMLAFNDIYRAAAASAGGEFVDIWDGFVDENGAYIASGPDINGQPARLRANDGINLARPGKRKVAFYAEKPLYKVLGLEPAAPGAAIAAAPRSPYRIMGPFGPTEADQPSDIDIPVDPNETGPIDPARPVALRTPGLDGGVELLGAFAEPRREARTAAEKLVIEGIAPAPQLGRADQSAGPQLASAASAAIRAINMDRTTNKTAAPSVPSDPAVDRAEPRLVRGDVLTAPPPAAPLQAPPTIQPDRLEEISPAQAAPDVAALPPPMMSPATLDRPTVPDAAVGDVRDLAPSRGAPQQAYKRPKSIGPEPNRAPTALPPPAESVEELLAPAETEPEVPSASNQGATEPGDATPEQPDKAPTKAGAPSVVQEPANDTAPARGAPGDAEPVPVAALPEGKDEPGELQPSPVAPTVVAPAAAIEPDAELAEAKAAPVGAVLTAPISAPAMAAPAVLPATPVTIHNTAMPVPTSRAAVPDAPARPVPPGALLTAPVHAPATAAPATLPVALPDTPVPSAQPATASEPAEAVRPAPIAPAPPTAVPTGSPAGSPAAGEKAEATPAAPANPVTTAQPSSATPG